MKRIEPYWKIEAQRIVTAALALHARTLPEAVVEALRLASNVAGGWEVGRPEEAGDGFMALRRLSVWQLPRLGRCLRQLGLLAARTAVAAAIMLVCLTRSSGRSRCRADARR